MELALYFYNECGFCRRVLSKIDSLKISDKIVLKNILENRAYEKELIALCGNRTVPTLVIDGKPMHESADINSFLEETFSVHDPSGSS